MGAIKPPEPISVEAYLEGELVSETKHEYVAGAIYAMAGANNRHNAIAGNALVSFANGLRGKPCRPFNSDTKVRIDLGDGVRFFYPDASVVCEGNADEESFQQKPVVIVEVLSPSTRRTDLGEKYQAYLALPSLKVLLYVEPDLPAVTCHRRQPNGAFAQEIVEGLEASIALPEIDTTLALADLYDRISFPTS